jgi:hypothetical protein
MSKLGRQLSETESELCDRCDEYHDGEGHKRILQVDQIIANIRRIADGYGDKGQTSEQMRAREDQRHNIAGIIKQQAPRGGNATSKQKYLDTKIVKDYQ